MKNCLTIGNQASLLAHWRHLLLLLHSEGDALTVRFHMLDP